MTTAGQVVTASLATHDFDAMAGGLPGWNARLAQVGAGRFVGSFDYVMAGGTSVCRVDANQPIHVRGSHRQKTYGLGLPALTGGESVVSGRRMRPGQALLLPPGVPIDQITSPDYAAVFVEIEEELFRSGLEALLGQDLDSSKVPYPLITPNSEAGKRLSCFLRKTIEAALAAKSCIGDTNRQETWKDQLLQYIADCLEPTPSHATYSDSGSSRQALFREAEQIMLQRPSGDLTLLELCRRLEVSRRSLMYAFEDVVGQPPMRWYRLHRLNEARARLKEVESSGAGVAEIARNFGFDHPGQFAIDFRRLFGQLPSEFLRRPRS